jgi:hypothetical protein
VSESEAWRTIARIATGIDRTEALLTHLEEKVNDIAATVSRMTIGHGAPEEIGVTDALTFAELVALYRDHPRWAVWLPAPGGQWAAARPAGSRPPGPEMPLIWVDAGTPAELGARMGQADGTLALGQGQLLGGWPRSHQGTSGCGGGWGCSSGRSAGGWSVFGCCKSAWCWSGGGITGVGGCAVGGATFG